MNELLFDRKLLRLNRARMFTHFDQHNFLHHEVAKRIAENAESLNLATNHLLEIGALDGYLSSLIASKKKTRIDLDLRTCSKSRCGEASSAVLSSTEAERTSSYMSIGTQKNSARSPSAVRDFEQVLIADDEFLPFKPQTFDLVVSNLNMHFINEIPQFLLQVKNILKPGGVFIASFFGEENLRELAHVLHKSEVEIYDGISPRMPPTIDVKTAAMLLQKAGFAEAISDFEKIEVSYSDPKNLLRDLKMMGQGNILTKRSRKFFTKKFLQKILQNYRELYGAADDTVQATFEIITATGRR